MNNDSLGNPLSVWAVIVVIVAGLALTLWRGCPNPDPATDTLRLRVQALEEDVQELQDWRVEVEPVADVLVRCQSCGAVAVARVPVAEYYADPVAVVREAFSAADGYLWDGDKLIRCPQCEESDSGEEAND